MLPREEKYIYEWETKRGKGKWSYIFLTALVWGSVFPVVILAFRLAFNGSLSFREITDRVFADTFLHTWLKFVGGFFLFAMLMWYMARRKYLQLKRKQLMDGKLTTTR